MSAKSVLTALITGNWGDITSPKRVPSKDREVGNAIVASIFPDPLTDTRLTTNVLTAVAADSSGYFDYSLAFWRQGAFIFFKGTIKNADSGGTQYNEDIATITNTDYLPLDATVFIGTNQYGDTMSLLVSGNKFHLNSSLITHHLLNFNGFYPALN